MNILITGATGYVGSRLVAELSKIHEVISLVREYYQGSLMNDFQKHYKLYRTINWTNLN